MAQGKINRKKQDEKKERKKKDEENTAEPGLGRLHGEINSKQPAFQYSLYHECGESHLIWAPGV
eukprot:3125168-Rhodomonas_salina.1